MKQPKFSVYKYPLIQIYKSYMGLILKYSSLVLGWLYSIEEDTLERFEHEAACIVTGSTRSTF